MTVVNIELINHSSIINFSKKCSYATLLAEPGFQVSTLEYLLGGHVTTGAAAPAPPSGDQKPFSFRNCKCKFVDVITITDELVLFFVISLFNRSGRHQLKYHQPEHNFYKCVGYTNLRNIQITMKLPKIESYPNSQLLFYGR